MAWEEIRIEKGSDLHDQFDSLFDGSLSENPYLFRRQSDARWSLRDSLSRPLQDFLHVADVRPFEINAFKHFFGQAQLFLDPSSLPARKSLVAWWTLMQHFGCPTRLLDWTKSPFVATYFAVSDNIEQDGAIWAFDASSAVRSDTGPTIVDVRKTIDETEDNVDVFWKGPQKQFMHPFVLVRQHLRCVTQQGAFTLCGILGTEHDQIIDNLLVGGDPRSHLKFIIDRDLKLDALGRLMSMNITASSLFPGLDGFGRSIRESLLVEIPHFDLF
jgi:hypothetical protein